MASNQTELSEMEMTDGYLSIVTPSGSVFYLNEDEAIIPSLIKLIAKEYDHE